MNYRICLGVKEKGKKMLQKCCSWKEYSSFYALSAFFVPVFILLIGYCVRAIAPFGDNSLMAIDAYGQYFPMLREARRAFRQGQWYSFSGELGHSVVAQSAYYTNSPLWILLYLLPFDITAAGVDCIVCLRFGLSGFTFYWWLSKKFGEKRIGSVVLATCYSLSGYSLSFIHQFMWMDAVWLLPLVVLGIEQIWDRKKSLLYFISLALTIYSCFYTAYMVCIFAVLWFFVCLLTKKKDWRSVWSAGWRFSLFSFLAGAVNFPILFTLYKTISKTIAADLTWNGELKWYHCWGEMLIRLLPFQKASLEYGAPNLYFSIVGVILLILALFSPKIQWKTKIVYILLLTFLFLSFNLNLLDYIWHGFHFPNQLPGRQSFLFIFVALTAAFVGWDFLNDRLSKCALGQISCCLAIVEIFANCIFFFNTYLYTVPVAALTPLEENIATFEAYITPDYEQGEFFRTELTNYRDNGGMLYGYNGISYYSSTMSADAYYFFKKLGIPIYAQNVSTRYVESPILNSLFGVRYLIASDRETDAFSEVVAESGDLVLIENSTALPLAFLADTEVLKVDTTLSGIKLQNDLFKKAAGCQDVIVGGKLDKRVFLQAVQKLQNRGMRIDKISKNRITGKIDTDLEGVLLITLPYDDISAYLNGKKAEKVKICGYLCGVLLPAGEYNVEIRLNLF
jgi:uncharacterized membrane protein YfhO